jgi:hypothetical protein
MRLEMEKSEFRCNALPVELPSVIRREATELVDREINHLRELIERTTAEKEVALGLQRTEYLRRLDELNNAHARAERAVLATVPRETFDVFVSDYNRWREEVMGEAKVSKASQAARDRLFYMAMAIMGLMMSVITIWMSSKSK